MKAKQFGAPYKGSKNQIAEWVIGVMPRADVFVDLFAGGCAVTHAALLSGKYKRIICNDIDGGGIQLFLDGINGKYKDETRWISRETFFSQKDKEPYIKFCWSFGFNGRNYMYGKDIEEYKHALHNAVFFSDYTMLREFFPNIKAQNGTKEQNYKSIRAQIREQTKTIQCENLQRLQSLQSLQSDYRAVNVPKGAIVYCDIPYEGTNGYSFKHNSNRSDFDNEGFYKWANAQKVPVFVSSYYVPNMTEIASIEKQSLMTRIGDQKKIERIYGNASAVKVANYGTFEQLAAF